MRNVQEQFLDAIVARKNAEVVAELRALLTGAPFWHQEESEREDEGESESESEDEQDDWEEPPPQQQQQQKQLVEAMQLMTHRELSVELMKWAVDDQEIKELIVRKMFDRHHIIRYVQFGDLLHQERVQLVVEMYGTPRTTSGAEPDEAQRTPSGHSDTPEGRRHTIDTSAIMRQLTMDEIIRHICALAATGRRQRTLGRRRSSLVSFASDVAVPSL